jgi:hypothetical protein
MVQVPTLIAVTLFPLMVQYLVVTDDSVVVPAVSVTAKSAVGLAIDSQPKSDKVSVFTALEIAKDLVTARAGLLETVPGFVAVIRQVPAPITLTVVLFKTVQIVGVAEVAVVTPALWVMLSGISWLPKVTL